MGQTLTGEVQHVVFENEDTGFRVFRLRGVRSHGSLTVVGVLPPVGVGTSVRVTGEMMVDPRRGTQFKADTLVPILPETLAGIERYLSSGFIQGIGAGFAKRIVAHFGLETLKVLDEDPERLREVPGLGKKRAAELFKAWNAQKLQSSVLLLLQSHGASPSLAARIVDRYGEKAASIVQQSPYRLAIEVRGIGFRTADKIAQSIGIAGDHPERAQAGVLHELRQLADNGHVLSSRQDLVQRAAGMLQVGEDHVESAIDALWAANRVVIEDGLVFLRRYHEAECNVVGFLRELLDSPGQSLTGLDHHIGLFEQRLDIQLAEAQRQAVELAAEHKVVVITGGPGVGKTTIIRAILSVFLGAQLEVRLAAPTGRAAKRLSEATGRDASTIHRLLEYDPRGGGFQKSADEPLDVGAVIVDEASMIDLTLAESLLAAIPPAARVVIVGDADQLPSVGPGAVLRDLIESGVLPTVRLNEVFRQAEQSRIVQNAHRIYRGERPESAPSEEPDADFFVIPRSDPEKAAEVIQLLVTQRIPARFQLDPLSDVQVLTPMHRGPSGTIALNAVLQETLNPTGATLERGGQRYRVGDKVMQTKNDYDREVFNGDIGRIIEVDTERKQVKVRFEEREVPPYALGELDNLNLAYACSIHKSQGSEYPAVVIPLLTSHFVMLSRNLLYTAVTRARRLCVLVADPKALDIALSEVRREERLTRLGQRLRLASGLSSHELM
ncbi:MAG: ATP-dependent RecD-like DNA helicase [Polyangiaceae bacterium]|nr:ATP-dependent RecD-like DNA helicase [Polyangiaceae bacterium]